MPINLESAQRILEGEMVDTITITRPGRDGDTGVFNPVTGLYDTEATDTLIYDGKAIVSTYGQEPRSRMEGGGEIKEDTYQIRIPLDADMPQENDIVVVTASLRDPDLVGQQYIIQSVPQSTFAVTRKIIAENRVLRRDP